MTSKEKPHFGRIKGGIKDHTLGDDSYIIRGEFLDHPLHRGMGHTSKVLSHDEKTGEIETKNSRYTIVADGEPSRFQDFPMAGDKMKFLAQNGYDLELKKAMLIFQKDQVYDVVDCFVEAWSHGVKFKGIDGWWNGVMFERV